jgi:hypothetical protein
MPEIQRQPIPQHQGNTGATLNPADYLPDMANAKLAEELIKTMGQPAIVSKKFVVYQGMWRALNHAPGHLTGYNCSLRNVLYDHVEVKSVNVDGKYFNAVWQYLMRPHYVITQNALPNQNAFDNQQPGLIRRIFNRLTGQGNPEQVNNGSK